LLAVLGDAAVRERYPNEALPGLTRKTIRTRTALLRELQNVRERGFAINNAESEAGLSALSCVIYNRTGEPRGAICISVPETRFRTVDRTRMAAAVRNACDAVSAAIR
jgi:DNA-binding IclR family transcriptional regulator